VVIGKIIKSCKSSDKRGLVRYVNLFLRESYKYAKSIFEVFIGKFYLHTIYTHLIPKEEKA